MYQKSQKTANNLPAEESSQVNPFAPRSFSSPSPATKPQQEAPEIQKQVEHTRHSESNWPDVSLFTNLPTPAVPSQVQMKLNVAKIGVRPLSNMIQRDGGGGSGGSVGSGLSTPAQQLLQSLKESQRTALNLPEHADILDKLGKLAQSGFAAPDTSGRIVFRKSGSWADAQNDAKNQLGASLSSLKVDKPPKQLYNESVSGYTLNVRNFGSEANTNGTIEIHVAGYIFEFKYKP